MTGIYLAQAPNPEPQIVGQRTIISESEYKDRTEPTSEPILSANFIYVLVAIGLLLLAAWAIMQYTKRQTIREPIKITPIKKKIRQ